MKLTSKTALKIFGTLCLSLVMLPAMALAQNRPQVQAGAGAGGGLGGMAGGAGVLQVMRQVITQLDLTADQKTNIQGVMRQAAQDARDAAAGLQDATPQERQQKMQDVQKIISDAKDKIEGELTPDQKAKYYPLVAKAFVKQFTDRAKAIQTAAAKLELTDDVKAQLKTVFDDGLKTLDGYKADADAVKDSQGTADLIQKLTKLQQDTRKQLVDILGQDDMQQLMQNMRQSATGTAATPRGADNTGGGKGLMPQDAPTTKPAAK